MEFFKATIIKKETESNDCISIYLKFDKQLFELYPGQFCYLKFNNDFNMMRPYSIATSQNSYLETNIIQFVIKQIPNGLVSNYIKEKLQINDQLDVSMPKGNLSIKDKLINNILFIAGGSGITMVKTFIEYCISNQKNIFLLYGVKFCDQIIFENYFKNVNSPFFKYKIFISNEQNHNYNNGFINKEVIDSTLKEMNYDSTFIVGPEIMISKMETNLKDINYLGKIYIE